MDGARPESRTPTIARLASAYSGRAAAIFSGDTVGDLVAGREAAGRLLRERKPAVDAYLEDAAARALQAHVGRRLQFEDLVPRRTGARLIASLTAIFDLDFHEPVLAT